MERLALKIKFLSCHSFIIILLSSILICPVFAEDASDIIFQSGKVQKTVSYEITENNREKEIVVAAEVIPVLSNDNILVDKVEDPVEIDADLVEYQDQSKVATATGNVKVRNKNLILLSPYVEYDTINGILDAYSSSKEKVIIEVSSDKLIGEHLKYNLITRQGVLTQASGKAQSLFMHGENVYIMPIEEAKDKGLVSKKRETHTEDEMIAKWINVSSTTCDFDEPHYRLETKKAIIIPNEKIILKRPKFYLGKAKMFTYPFDFIIALKKREQSIMPFFLYETNKGAGLGIRGILEFNRYGEVNIAAIGWSMGIWEAKFRYQKEIIDRLWVFAQSDRLYNKDEKETLWRPQWGANYTTRSGWTANLLFSQRELIETTMRPGLERRYNVWKDPEFKITSPWYGPAFSKLRFTSVYGKYQDNTDVVNPWIKRFGLVGELSGNPDVSWKNFKPYYGASYTYYDYDSGHNKQKITDAWMGLRWNIGAFNFVSQYAQRWVNGSSMLVWDNFGVRKDFYQSVSFPLPFGKKWEKWNVSIGGTYDLISNEVAVVNYTLDYNRHCTTWQLWVRDKIASNEKQFGLTFFINAFPEYKIGIGSDSLGDKSGGF